MSHISDVLVHGRSMDSIPSTFTNGSSSPNSNIFSFSIIERIFFFFIIIISLLLLIFFINRFSGLDPDISPDEQEEKARLIAQVLELQNTLDGLYI